MSDSAAAYTQAAAPFDHAKADIILRSSDNVYFRIFKLFLSLSSPFFETLFDIPQPADAGKDQEIKDGLVVVPVAENSKTLDALLRFCYPCTLAEDPTLEVLKDAADVLEAAREYSLDAVEIKARKAITNPKFLEAESLQCFVIARQGCMQEETKIAAKHTLSQPLIPLWFQEIDFVSAADLLALLTYHKRCGEAVYALRADQSWITTHYGSVESCNWIFGRHKYTDRHSGATHANCACQRAVTLKLFDRQTVGWWESFMEETFTELRDKPCKATVQTAAEQTIQTVKAKNCPTCAPTVAVSMRDFADLLARKVDEAVSQIELDFQF